MDKVNYHMHTTRCHHALGSDEDYVKAAIKAGFKEIGFTDHTPWHYESDYVSGMRMKESELDGYIASIRSLQDKYKDKISIKLGLECEYFPSMMSWLKHTIQEKGLDYIIFGHHFLENDEYGPYYGRPTTSKERLWDYVNGAIDGMRTGLYSYLAHPDLIHYLDTRDMEYTKAMETLCKAAKENNIPLEFNLLGHGDHRWYPCEDFWKIASKCKCQAIIGFDAHEPESLLNTALYEQAKAYLNGLGLEVIDKIRFLK